MRVKEVADLVGISVRTLHHYDAIGLLHPDTVTEAGYRKYAEKNLETVQQILFFKELGFSLRKIKEIIQDPFFDRLEALELQRQMIRKKRKRLDTILETIDKTISHEKGESEMTNKEKFAGFDFSKNPYEEEARKRWGDKVVNDAKEKTANQDFEAQFNSIYRELAEIRHEAPTSDIAQKGIEKWFNMLNTMGNYSLDAFKGLGEMYVADERFTNNIDQFGEGLAVFMRDAMNVYADRNQ